MEFNLIKFEVSGNLFCNGTEITLLIAFAFALCFVFMLLKMHR